MNNNTITANIANGQTSALPTPANGLFSFSGRIGRMQFFWIALTVSCTAMFLGIAMALVTTNLLPNAPGPAFGLLGLLLLVMLTGGCVGAAAGFKRFHDLGRPGWFYFALCIPIVGIVLLLYILFAKGTDQINRYGPPPNLAAAMWLQSLRKWNENGRHSNSVGEMPAGSLTPSEVATATSASSNNTKSGVTPRLQPPGHLDQPKLALAASFDENAAYGQIAHELETKSMDKGLWLRGLVQSGGGDERQQTIAYTSLRLQQLRGEFLTLKSANEATSAAAKATAIEERQQTSSSPTSLENQNGDQLQSQVNDDGALAEKTSVTEHTKDSWAPTVLVIFAGFVIVGILFFASQANTTPPPIAATVPSTTSTSQVPIPLVAPTASPNVPTGEEPFAWLKSASVEDLKSEAPAVAAEPVAPAALGTDNQ